MPVSVARQLFFISLLLIFKFSICQTYNFKNYSTDQGLAQTQVLCIYQDSKGYMWFGTNSGGASRFDGNKFNTINKNNGLPSDVVFSIIENRKGELLFGTNNGLCVYNHKRFKTYSQNEGLKNEWIFRLLEDSNKVWIGTQLGVYVYEKDQILSFDKDSILNHSSVYSLLRDKNGNIWFGTIQNGLIFYNIKQKTYKHFNTGNGLSNNFVFSLAQQKDGSILAGTQEGLNTIDPNFKVIVSADIQKSNNISFSSILNSKNNEYYFGSFNEGLVKFDFNTKNIKSFNSKNGLTNNTIFSVYKDRESNIWVGTGGKGVYKYFNDKFVYYTKLNGLPEDYINAISEDDKGNLWASIYGYGVVKIKEQEIINYKADFSKKSNSLPDNNINAILPAKDGAVYFATETGLARYYEGKFSTIRSGAFDQKFIQSLYQDTKGKIWIGTNDGVYSIVNGQVNDEKEINAFKKEGQQFLIFFAHESTGGDLFFGLEEGLLKFNGTKLQLLGKKEGFADARACNAVNDREGSTWFGSAEGLFIYSNDKLKRIDLPDGNSFGFITFLQVDKNNRLIVGTNQEIYIINLIDFYQGSLVFKRLGKEDGLLNKESNFNAAFVDKNGRVLVGTASGIEIYDPVSDIPNIKEPQTSITDVKLFFGLENALDYSQGIDSVTFLPRKLVLPASKNNITFNFVGISLSMPEKVMYTYKLEGLDKNWTPNNFKTEAVYPSLPPGSYTFMVKAMNNDGVWNKEAVSYSFIVLPPWYNTWWFRIITFIVLILATWFYIKYREKKLIREKESLEETIRVRTAQISEQKQLIEDKHKEITDSINYAERIQRSFLASTALLDKHLSDYFVYFQPKEAVSGDFYWASPLGNGNFALVTADSTGHGVPGAIMSILNITCLENAVKENFTEPNEILNHTRSNIIERLKKDGSAEGGKDGMDCTVLSLDLKKYKLTFSGANNPVWIVRESELLELQPDKMPVGKHDKDTNSFTQKEIALVKGDMIYSLTDGMPDQFGGPKGKKYMYRQLKDLLVQIAGKPTAEQKELISKSLNTWKGSHEQVDDITLIGVKV